MEWTPQAYSENGLRASIDPIAIPFGPKDVASVLDNAVRNDPEKEALVGRYSRFSYRQYDDAINAAAAFLRESGLRPGDRLAASAGNHPEIVIAFFATMRLGAIWVGINRKLARAEKLFLLGDAGAKILLADDDVIAELADHGEDLPLDRTISIEAANPSSAWRVGLAKHANAVRREVGIGPWAPAAIAYTSGTTGFPKGAIHSQHNIMLVPTVRQHDSDPGELARQRYGTTTPLTILNLMILGPVAAARAGSTHICMDRTDPVGVVEWIAKESITATSCAPTTVYDMLTRPDIDQNDLRSLVKLSIGGATVPERLPALYYERFGCMPQIGYGLTEAPTGLAASIPHEDGSSSPKPQGEIGPALPQFDVEILDEDGNTVENGRSGEICARAAQTGPFANMYRPALGYWRNAQATEKLLRGGWLHTGDVGFKDHNGNLHIQDRRTDVIIRGGSNIYPAEIERVLRMEHRVSDCAVLGKPDARLGQVVVAFVQPIETAKTDPTLPEALEDLCRENLARYKHPAEWHLIDDMPRNGAGKVVKPQLKALLV